MEVWLWNGSKREKEGPFVHESSQVLRGLISARATSTANNGFILLEVLSEISRSESS